VLAGAALAALAPSGGAAALAAHSGPAPSHPAIDRLTWNVVPSPSQGESELLGVSCLSASSCTAVGGGANQTLVESWNGTSWSIVPSPNRGGFGELFGVSCASASACTAVGTSAPSATSPQNQDRTLAESWNGTTWSIVPTSNPHKSRGYDILSSVSCVTAAFCAAVGSYGQAGASEPLTEIWNGSTWSAVPSPNKLDDASLQGVSCGSAKACTAVGFQYHETVIESWNGRTWSLVPSPGLTSNPQLSGVSCASAWACVAVGFYFDDSLDPPAGRTLAESGKGITWSVTPSPNPAGIGVEAGLAGVSCTSPRTCIAVGSADTGDITSSSALIEAWNGTRWSIVPSHPTRNAATLLYSVSCPSATMCMATGVSYGSSGQGPGLTLAELGTLPG
jgi:hypothetical protein